MNDFLNLYGRHFKNVKVDKYLVKELRKLRIAWCQKSDDYINFLASNLTGVYVVRYSDIDENKFYRLMRVDARALKKETHMLEDIDPTRNISSNSTYLSFVYLMHRFSLLSDKKIRDEGMRELHFLCSIKALGSMFYRFFPFAADPNAAKAVFEALSNRFIIKQVGSWQKVIDYRSNDVLENGIYYDRIKNINTEYGTKIVAGIHSGYKSMLIYIYGVIMKIDKSKDSIGLTSIIESLEDGDHIRDNIDSPSLMTDYLVRILPYPNDLINGDLIHLVVVISKNISKDALRDVIHYSSKNYTHEDKEMYSQILENSVAYLTSKRVIDPTKDIMKSLNMLKGYWSSGNKENIKLKNKIRVYCYKATGRKTSWLLSSLTISFIIYIYLRTITKK